MRAVYLKDLKRDSLQENEIFTIQQEAGNGERDKILHHLLNVVRIQTEQELLLLDGKGSKYFSVVQEVKKRFLQVKVIKVEHDPDSLCQRLHVGVCILKKEAMEEVIKICVELGIGRMIPLISDFSSSSFMDNERVGRLIESSMIQSNNPYYLDIGKAISLRELSFGEYQKVLYFSSRKNFAREIQETSNKVEAGLVNRRDNGEQRPFLILIGPEGGMSEEEEYWIHGQANAEIIHLPTYILRSPHAVATATGYFLAHYFIE